MIDFEERIECNRMAKQTFYCFPFNTESSFRPVAISPEPEFHLTSVHRELFTGLLSAVPAFLFAASVFGELEYFEWVFDAEFRPANILHVELYESDANLREFLWYLDSPTTVCVARVVFWKIWRLDDPLLAKGLFSFAFIIS